MGTSILLFTGLLAQSPAVNGTLTIDGKAMKVRSACAWEQEDPFDEKKVRVHVALSTAERGSATACKGFRDEAMRRTEAGGSHALLVAELAAPELVWVVGSFFFNDTPHMFSRSGNEKNMVFEPSGTGGNFGGRLVIGGPDQVLFRSDLKLDATFALPLEKLVPKPAPVTGEAASRHPAAIAVKNFLNAMKAGDVERVLAGIVTDERARFEAMMKSGDREEVLKSMKESAADALSLPEATVWVQGESAEVALSKASGASKERAKFRLRLEQGAWRITRGG